MLHIRWSTSLLLVYGTTRYVLAWVIIFIVLVLPNILYGAIFSSRPMSSYDLLVPASLTVIVLQVRQPNHRHGLLSLRRLITLLHWLVRINLTTFYFHRGLLIFFFVILFSSNFSIQGFYVFLHLLVVILVCFRGIVLNRHSLLNLENLIRLYWVCLKLWFWPHDLDNLLIAFEDHYLILLRRWLTLWVRRLD